MEVPRRQKPLARYVKVYHQGRTAHLERLDVATVSTLLYSGRRYDFDDEAIGTADVRQADDYTAARLLARFPVEVLEVTEPAYLPGVRRAALAVAASRCPFRLGPRPRVVTYAIANSDPRREWPAQTLKQQASRALSVWLSHWLARRLDRVVFGTEASQALYSSLYRLATGAAIRVIPALPSPCGCASTELPDDRRIVFLGAFADRKGFPDVLAAWERLRVVVPEATLCLIGMGALVDDARRVAKLDERVNLLESPPRGQIHDELRRATVLVLPSRPSPTWREQVGLPIVEGLQHGLTIVTTEQTGLASWLDDHGHHVVPSVQGAPGLAAALSEALTHPVDRDAVLSSLPPEDGRAAAERWFVER